jgi:urea carboxylase
LQVQEWLAAASVPGLVETSPGVRSVMIEYDQRILPLADLVKLVMRAESEMPPVGKVHLPTRVLRLPLAFNDRWTLEAIAKYTRSVRAEAPYLPSNVEFVAKGNGLEGDPIAAVRDVITAASYMVLGLGDVYLGAPCAVPVDPRHRLVVPKYNPARTFTPEGGVGIGGCYMCIYPMESPGGYQLIGRTLPIWNTHTRAGPFEKGKPWLLRNFDQVKYFIVSEDELERMRKDFVNGRLEIEITEEEFDMAAYNKMVAEAGPEVEAMRVRQRVAMEEMMRIDAEQLARIDSMKSLATTSSMSLADNGGSQDPYADRNGDAVRAAVTGTVWELRAEVGQEVKAGDVLMVLEAMKMEYAVVAGTDGCIVDIAVATGDMVQQGAALCLVE